MDFFYHIPMKNENLNHQNSFSSYFTQCSWLQWLLKLALSSIPFNFDINFSYRKWCSKSKTHFYSTTNDFYSSLSSLLHLSVDSKSNKVHMKSENELLESNEPIAQFTSVQPNQQSFMMRPGNQSYRFGGPQTFIHQQPPPMSQNSQFNGPRGQIMSNSNLYQNVCQSQMMQPPPITTAPATNQYIQQQQDMNVYQQNSHFHQHSQPGSVNRFSMPQQPSADGMPNHPQQPRFRSQW